MAVNCLEQLVAEWYEFQGYFVRRNVRVGKLASGGYDCELDVVAFHPEEKKLVHVEPSLGAESWAVRERRYKKKFDVGRKYIPSLFPGLQIPHHIDQIALLGFGSAKNRTQLGGGRIVFFPDFLVEIFEKLKTQRIESKAVPENFMIIRTLQFVHTSRQKVMKLWQS